MGKLIGLVLERIENIFGKGELVTIFCFPTVSSKALIPSAFNSLPYDNILDLIKVKAFANNK